MPSQISRLATSLTTKSEIYSFQSLTGLTNLRKGQVSEKPIIWPLLSLSHQLLKLILL